MSEINYNPICPACGETNEHGSRFCAVCGVDMKRRARKKNPAVPVVVDAASSNAPAWYRGLHKPAVYNGIVALICLCLLLLLFAPFVSVRTHIAGKRSYSTSFSPSDMLEYMSASFASYDDNQIKRTAEYRQYKRLGSRVGISESGVPSATARAGTLEEYTRISVKVGLMRARSAPSWSLVIASMMTVAYAVIAFCGLIMSTVSFIRALCGKEDSAGGGRKASRLVGFLALYIPMYIVMLMQACRFPHSLTVAGFGNAGVGISWGLVVTLLILLSVPVYIVIRCYSRLTGFEGFKVKLKDKAKAVGIFLLAAAVSAVFLPAVSVRFASEVGRGSREAAAQVGLADMSYLPYGDARYYSSCYPIYSPEQIAEIADEATGKGELSEDVGAGALHGALTAFSNLSVLYIFNTLIALSFMALALAFIGKLIGSLLHGGTVNAPKYLAWMIVLASHYLGMCISIAVSANACLPRSVSRYLLFGVGLGSILMLSLVIAATVVLSLREKKRVEGGYDNPDVSSTPYVTDTES